MSKKSQLEYLSERTPKGIFLTADGSHCWVFDSNRGRVAMHLESTPARPAFSYNELDAIPIAAGKWLGRVQLRTGGFRRPASRGVAGVLCWYRDRLHIKACHSSGNSVRLMFNEYLSKKTANCSRYCEHWSLTIVDNWTPKTVFELIRPTPLARYRPSRAGEFSEPTRAGVQ